MVLYKSTKSNIYVYITAVSIQTLEVQILLQSFQIYGNISLHAAPVHSALHISAWL